MIESIGLKDERIGDPNQKFADCKAQKDFVAGDIRESYWFAAPDRHRSARMSPGQAPSKNDDAADRWTSFLEECCQDFATEIWGAFFVGEWAKQRPSTGLPEGKKKQLEEKIEKNTVIIHEAIKHSNFEAAFNQGAVPDLAIGTTALWIESMRADEPIVCHPVPIRELEINLGPNGTDDRWLVRQVQHRYLKTVLSGVTLPDKFEKLIKSKPKDRCEVRRGFWRDWADAGNVAWISVIMIGRELIHAERLVGEGSCPLIPMRFNPDPTFAFGNGPMRQKLPEARALDELEGLALEHVEHAVHPAFAYSSEANANFENGIESGMGYAMDGHKVDEMFRSLFFEGDLDTAWFAEDKLVRSIRRGFFIDRPEQTGDTPPSATQWVDEMALAQRRLGVPGASFWEEGPKAVFQRFAYLLENRGALEKLEVGDKRIPVVPYNPSERAKDLQEVQMAQNLLGSIMQFFPQLGQVIVNGPQTCENMKQKMGDRLVALLPADEAKKLIEQFAAGMASGEFQNVSKN